MGVPMTDIEQVREALETAPLPPTDISGLVPYMDWFFKVRIPALAALDRMETAAVPEGWQSEAMEEIFAEARKAVREFKEYPEEQSPRRAYLHGLANGLLKAGRAYDKRKPTQLVGSAAPLPPAAEEEKP
jgi:hypothetical protein